jgi:hypothetical protein
VGYCDPIGQSNFDADPVSILRGGPNQELARRFVVFCLTEEAQALWQFRAHDATNPKTLDGHTMGPEQYELRRLPVRRDLYERYQTHMIDRIDPFKLAPDARPVGWRDAIAVMLPAFSVDILDAQRDAWKALTSARADPAFPASALARMESLFYAFPGSTLPDGRVLEFVPKDFPALARAWRDSRARGAFKREYSLGYTEFFRDNYRQVVALAAHPH